MFNLNLIITCTIHRFASNMSTCSGVNGIEFGFKLEDCMLACGLGPLGGTYIIGFAEG